MNKLKDMPEQAQKIKDDLAAIDKAHEGEPRKSSGMHTPPPNMPPLSKGMGRIRGLLSKNVQVAYYAASAIREIDALETDRVHSTQPEYQRLISVAQTEVEAAFDAIKKVYEYGTPE